MKSSKNPFTFHWYVIITILLSAFFFSDCTNTENEEASILIASYGGEWQRVQQQTMFKPYAENSGVEVIDVEYDGQYASLTGVNADWDIVAVEKNMVSLGTEDEILEPIDYSIVDSSNLNPDAIHEYGVGIMAWSFVLAYDTDTFTETPPANWSDFFNVEEFPGSRGLKDDPRRVLEVALMADGVNKEELYPLDVERALQKLEQLVQDLNNNGDELILWQSYADPIALFADHEVVMTPATNGRIFLAVEQNNLPVGFSWEEGIVDFDWWVVLKDSVVKEEAMNFINYASSVEAQTEMAMEITYGPINNKALNSMSEGEREMLPTTSANLEKQLIFDNEWWSTNYDMVIPQWNEWTGSL